MKHVATAILAVMLGIMFAAVIVAAALFFAGVIALLPAHAASQ